MPRSSGIATLVDSADLLAEKCAAWRRCEALGVDTEFVRERTFFPGLGLIQVSDGEEHALVDPLAIDDLAPLAGVLADPGVVKVLHSCSEDLEVFYHRFGDFPRPVFDTQIAAAFAGLGYSLGYGKLVETLFGVELPKGETRSNWLERPLSEAQQVYAARDVAYLLPAWRQLRRELRRRGREAWVAEEIEQLADPTRLLPDPDTLYLALGRARGVSRRDLAVLKELSAWREREARQRDLPRNFVLPKAALLDVARRRPRTLEELGAIRSVRPADVKRHGRAILELIERTAVLPTEELPEKPTPPLDLTPYRRTVDRLRHRVAERAEELGLPIELLASRKVIEAVVRAAASGKTPPWPDWLEGWRRQVLTDLLDELELPARSVGVRSVAAPDQSS